MSEKILLIDGHSILNRAFYGLPDLTNSEGKHTGAVYGFLNILFRTIEEEKPQYLTVAFDLKAPTFRHKMFEAYKGTRKPMPEELREQVPLMKEVLRAMHMRQMIFWELWQRRARQRGWTRQSFPGTGICFSLRRIRL